MRFEYGLVILLVTAVISRIVSERAYKLLSQDEKARLMDAYSGMRAYCLLPLAAIIGAYVLASSRWPNYEGLLTSLYLAALVAYIAISQVFVYRTLGGLGVTNRWFHGLFVASRVVLYLGIATIIFFL
jgi:hypothetical protein